MKFAEFTENINQVYSGKFAHSACIVRPYRCLGRCIYIDCMLAENLNEVSLYKIFLFLQLKKNIILRGNGKVKFGVNIFFMFLV